MCVFIIIGYCLNIGVVHFYDKRNYAQETMPLTYIPYLGFIAHCLVYLYYWIIQGYIKK